MTARLQDEQKRLASMPKAPRSHDELEGKLLLYVIAQFITLICLITDIRFFPCSLAPFVGEGSASEALDVSRRIRQRRLESSLSAGESGRSQRLIQQSAHGVHASVQEIGERVGSSAAAVLKSAVLKSAVTKSAELKSFTCESTNLTRPSGGSRCWLPCLADALAHSNAYQHRWQEQEQAE